MKANKYISIGARIMCLALLLAGCGPADNRELTMSERRSDECEYKICPGDKLPPHDFAKDELLKLDGRWFVGPKAYFSNSMNGAAFLWPSGKPLRSEDPEESNASGIPPGESTIEIFLRSRLLPTGPYGYALVELAEMNQWIEERTTLRPGLDRVRMKHEIGPTGQYLDSLTYYVATDLKGVDGLPPVATCNHGDAGNTGGTGFMWRDGIWAGTRMNQRLCADSPEIYQETMRVLSLLKEIGQ